MTEGAAMLFDTHLHLVDRTRLRYPWLADVPALNRDWGFADYCQSAARLGITDALHMEVDVDPADIDAETAMVADLMAQPDSILRGAISAARPESPDFADWLARVDRRIVRGVRRVLHVMPDDLSQSVLFRDNIRRLGAAGLPFDICVQERQLPLAMALADAAPDCQFVLDHCGVPTMAGGDFGQWARSIADIAARPNVCAKVSGIIAYGGGGWSLASLRPYVETLIGHFGWDRVVWGSDSPVCTLHASLPEWVAVTRALLAEVSADERARFSHLNARRIWGL